MNIQNWAIQISAPIVDPTNNNKVKVSVTYSFNDGTHAYQVTDDYSGVLGVDGLTKLIQDNFAAHQSFVDALLNTPVGNVDLTKLFPTASSPAPVLTTK